MPRKGKKTKMEIVMVSGSFIRAQYGYPCFHCGATLKACRDVVRRWPRSRMRCCKRCKGMPSHD